MSVSLEFRRAVEEVIRSFLPNSRVHGAQGATVASANNLTLGMDGNTFPISGTTQINLIDATGWQGGDEIMLIFASVLTMKHGQASSGAFKQFVLASSADFVTAVSSTLTLTYNSVNSVWYEKCRKA